MVELHEGNIEVESAPDKGTEFIIDLSIKKTEGEELNKASSYYPEKIVSTHEMKFSDIIN